jgi:succinate dehydrogenase / fumarate reductase membrane anchor subunit
LAERVSAIALVPLSLWFSAAMIAHTRSGYAEFVAWVKEPPTATLLILLLIGSFHHAALGLQVIVEDYLHSGLKFAVAIGVRLACYACAVAGIIAVLRVTFGV